MPSICGPNGKFALDSPVYGDLDTIDSTISDKFAFKLDQKVNTKEGCEACLSTLYAEGLNRGGRCKKEGDLYKVVGCKKGSGAKCETLVDKIASKIGGKVVLYTLVSLFVLSILLKMFHSGRRRRSHPHFYPRQGTVLPESNYL